MSEAHRDDHSLASLTHWRTMYPGESLKTGDSMARQ